MGITEASAPAKVILCGEHAVVYGCPAIALPLGNLRAYASVRDGPPGGPMRFRATNLHREWDVGSSATEPLGELALATMRYLGRDPTSLVITLSSDIPIASGMGSGAAIATALVRALTTHMGRALSPQEISALVYTSEQRYHGTPSGIDNTVVAYETPIYFQRSTPPRPGTSPLSSSANIIPLPVPDDEPLNLVIGDTGKHVPTHEPVNDLRRRYQESPQLYDIIFHYITALVKEAGDNIHCRYHEGLGALLDRNHYLLQELHLSSPELDTLVLAARKAGALGAKLSGAGWGGIMVALVRADGSDRVAKALLDAGAVQVYLASTAPPAR